MRKTTENKAFFGMFVTNLDKFLVMLVQEKREYVGEDSHTLCMCTFPLDKCAEYTRHTQIANKGKTVFPAWRKALLYYTRVVCIDSPKNLLM